MNSRSLFIKTFSTVFILFVLFLFATFIIHGFQEDLKLEDAIASSNSKNQFILLSNGSTRYEYEPLDTTEVLIFIHGGAILGSDIWRKNIPYFKSRGWSTFTYDQYGKGYSSRDPKKYDFILIYDQFVELMDSLNLSNKKINLISHSLGAMIAVKYHHEHPENIERVILVSPSLFGDFEPSWFLKTPLLSSLLMTYYWRPQYLKKRRVEFYKEESYNEYINIIDYYSRIKGFKNNYLETWLNVITTSVESELKFQDIEKSYDFMIIYGDHDPYFNDALKTKLEHLLPFGRFVQIDKTGHMPNFEDPASVNQNIIEFIKN